MYPQNRTLHRPVVIGRRYRNVNFGTMSKKLDYNTINKYVKRVLRSLRSERKMGRGGGKREEEMCRGRISGRAHCREIWLCSSRCRTAV